MKTVKMNLANLQGKLSRKEMRNIMAGSGGGGPCRYSCTSDSDCGGGGEYSCQKCSGLSGHKTCSNS